MFGKAYSTKDDFFNSTLAFVHERMYSMIFFVTFIHLKKPKDVKLKLKNLSIKTDHIGVKCKGNPTMV